MVQLPNNLPKDAEQEFSVAPLQLKPPHETPDRSLKRIRGIQLGIVAGTERIKQSIDHALDFAG
jgi:hypothetical protein